MAREYSRTERVADYIQRELADLIQHEVRDPRIGMVNITGAEVSRDLAYATVFFTLLDTGGGTDVEQCAAALNGAAGFLRTRLSRESHLRTVPQLRFRFDTSVSHGRHLDDLIRRAADADRALGLRDHEKPGES